MKKILSLILCGLLANFCFACGDEIHEEKIKDGPCGMMIACDTIIKDLNGEDKCYWNDGAVYWNDFRNQGYQTHKIAVLDLNCEYDLSYCYGEEKDCVDFTPDNAIVKYRFECDENKIAVRENPEIEDHFILTVLQPCKDEPFQIKIYEKGTIGVKDYYFISITISTTKKSGFIFGGH